MAGKWKEMSFTEAVEVNSRVPLSKGTEYPFVDVAALEPARPFVSESGWRLFGGGGSKFEAYDTLMARITPCLENGKIARYVPLSQGAKSTAFGSTEFIVIRGREGVTENDYTFYLTKWQI